MKTIIVFTSAFLFAGAAMAQDVQVKNQTASSTQASIPPVESRVATRTEATAKVNAKPAAQKVERTAQQAKAVQQEVRAEAAAQAEATGSHVKQGVQTAQQAVVQERPVAVQANTAAGVNAQASPAALPVKRAEVRTSTRSNIGVQGSVHPVRTHAGAQAKVRSGVGIGLH